MKRSLRSIWFIYGFLIFFIQVLFFFPFYVLGFFFFGKRAVRPAIKFAYHGISRVTLFLFGIRVKYHGLEHIDKKQTYIYISNHQSALDVLLYSATVPFVFKFLGKKETGKIPMLGYVARRISVLVDRSSSESRANSLQLLKEALQGGFSICIAPEGTRNRTDELLTKFYDGAFRLAIETGTPILVQTLAHPGKLNDPRHALDLWPGTVHCCFDVPISTKDMTMNNFSVLKEQARSIMLNNLKMY